MEKPRGAEVDYQEKMTNLEEGGGRRLGHAPSSIGVWWLPRREKHTRVGAWATLCQLFFLRWVDRTKAIPKVGSPAGKKCHWKIFLAVEVI